MNTEALRRRIADLEARKLPEAPLILFRQVVEADGTPGELLERTPTGQYIPATIESLASAKVTLPIKNP